MGVPSVDDRALVMARGVPSSRSRPLKGPASSAGVLLFFFIFVIDFLLSSLAPVRRRGGQRPVERFQTLVASAFVVRRVEIGIRLVWR